MQTNERLGNWGIFILLSIIWGSSFILMKAGMHVLSAYQVAALRMLSAGTVLVPTAVKNFKQLPKSKIPLIVFSGLLGSFFPAFLFCIAETKIDSSLAGILNALTPLFTIIIGAAFFATKVYWQKVVGVLIGFVGLILLFLSRGNIELNYLSYAALVLLATIMYGVNVNLVSHYLKDIGSLNIAAFAFCFLIFPSILVLVFTGYFSLPLLTKTYVLSTLASVVLGVMGTAVASILFYKLLKRAGALFASMVTYGIPFIAIVWGLIFGETITVMQIGCLGIILAGVYLANKS